MRSIFWTKPTLAFLLSGAIAAGCGPDSKPSESRANEVAPTCGNNKVESGEVCDGTDLDNRNCQTAMMGVFTGGNLRCAADCGGFIIAGCTRPGGGTGGSGGATVGSGGAPARRGSGGATSSKGGAGGTTSTGGGGGVVGKGGTGGKEAVDSGREAGSDASKSSSGGGTSILDSGKRDASDAKVP